MADKALFSSFRRPEPLAPGSVEEARPAPLAAASLPETVATPVIPAEGTPADIIADHPAEAPAALQAVREPLGGSPVSTAGPWADLSSIAVGSDQLGLINPVVITLRAKLPDCSSVLLEAETAGIYRPPGFRPAPWSGFAYDQPANLATGLGAGTRILTARGEVEVEKLVPGDAAMTLRGPALLPISWIGRTSGAPSPIQIEPGALGPNVPRRMLCVGPDQAVFIKPVPVAAHTLVNGTTIRRSGAVASELFHIDVGRAEVIFAEGLALSSSHGASSPA